MSTAHLAPTVCIARGIPLPTTRSHEAAPGAPCPECGAPLIRASACIGCARCGWGKCP